MNSLSGLRAVTLPKITVIIVNWNSGSLLHTCLQTLSKQSTMPQQVIVVDNASSDNSAGCVSAFPFATCLQMTSNLGFAAANNIALAQSTTEFVALLNPDAFPESDWLENLLHAAQQYPNVAAFGSRQLCQHNPQILDGIGDSYHLSGLVWRDRHGLPQQLADLQPREIFSPCAAAALYRRQALWDIGGFDEDYFCYVEDVDVGFRLRLAGHQAIYVPNAVVHHVGSATTGGQRSDFSVYHGHRNLVWTFVKNMPSVLFWLLLPLHLLLTVVTVLWFVKNGQGKVILKAKQDAIKGLAQVWKKRQHIQAARIVPISEIWRILDKRLLLRNK